MTKLCIDCRHAKPATGGEGWICNHPLSVAQDDRSLVTGERPPPYQVSCYQARLNHYVDQPCGTVGRHWEARS